MIRKQPAPMNHLPTLPDQLEETKMQMWAGFPALQHNSNRHTHVLADTLPVTPILQPLISYKYPTNFGYVSESGPIFQTSLDWLLF